MLPIPPGAADVIDAHDAEVSVELHLLDPHGRPDVDLTDLLDPDGSQVDYHADDRVHHTCTLILDPAADRRIAWSRDRVAVTMTVRAAAGTVTGQLGTFELVSPDRSLDDALRVTGYDSTRRLTKPLGGDATSIPVDADPIAAMRTIVESRGLQLRAVAAGDAPATARPRPVSPADLATDVLDGLAGDAGFVAPWADHDGIMVTEPVRLAADHAPEWHYDADSPTTTVLDVRRAVDVEAVPNAVLYRTNARLAWPARDGDGQTVRINQSSGPTSLDARGYPVWDVVDLPATNQTVLELQADADWEARGALMEEWTIETAPSPLHSHRDRIEVSSSDLDVVRRTLLVVARTVPLDGSPMRLTGRSL